MCVVIWVGLWVHHQWVVSKLKAGADRLLIGRFDMI
jgi:hypothetical protein